MSMNAPNLAPQPSISNDRLYIGVYDLNNSFLESSVSAEHSDPYLPTYNRRMATQYLTGALFLEMPMTGNNVSVLHEYSKNPEFAKFMGRAAYLGTDVGLHLDSRGPAGEWVSLAGYPETHNWSAETATAFLESNEALFKMQKGNAQTDYKRSAFLRQPVAPEDEQATREYLQENYDAFAHWGGRNSEGYVVLSGGLYVDILPKNGQGTPFSKGTAIDRIKEFALSEVQAIHAIASAGGNLPKTYLEKLIAPTWGWNSEEPIAAPMPTEVRTIGYGDSGNDLEMLAHADIGRLAGNADDIILARAQEIDPTIQRARQKHGLGLIEILEEEGVLPRLEDVG